MTPSAAAFTSLTLATLDLPRPGIEEDAPALALMGDSGALLGVFDGLGGAGARTVDGEDGRRSSAYYAARTVRAATAELFAAHGTAPIRFADALAREAGERLARRHRTAPPAKGPVRSRLLRSYPTTAALLLVSRRDAIVGLHAIWAGDSRCYALTPHDGLQQLSADDTTAMSGPMRGSRDDGTMTNLLCAGEPVCLHVAERRIDAPAILLAATDGVFGSLPSPMHFEWLLLDALASAGCPEEWAAALAARLVPLADDDASLAAAFAGWEPGRFAARRAWLTALLATPPDAAWSHYRSGYMAIAPA